MDSRIVYYVDNMLFTPTMGMFQPHAAGATA